MPFERKYFEETSWGQLELDLKMLSARDFLALRRRVKDEELAEDTEEDSTERMFNIWDEMCTDVALGGHQFDRFSDLPTDVVAEVGQKLLDFLTEPPTQVS